MKKRIVLELDQATGIWMARFEGDREIMRLFETDTLPTPFTSSTDSLDVLAKIRQLNPGVEVLLA